jgi:copper chaperone
VVFGLGYEAIFGSLAVGGAAHSEHGDHTGWTSILATLMLGGAMMWFAGEDLRSAWGRRKDKMASDGAMVVGVTGMTCGGCASRLERLLRATEGVSEAAVSLESGAARVRGGVARAAIETVIRNAGFEPGAAPPGAFSETPPRG